jgi:glutamine synthetase
MPVTFENHTAPKSNNVQWTQNGKIVAEYVWIGGSGQDLRCKARTLDFIPTDPSQLPIWNFDGSSTGQAPGHDSEVILRPQRIFKDPFRGGDNILVMCDCYFPDGRPVETNHRLDSLKVMKAAADQHPWFGIEQEYTLFFKNRPIGWPKQGYPAPQGPYYCSVGASVNYGRQIIDEHYKVCLHAGVTISGINAEVLCGQWEFQVGPCEGIDIGDELWMARYLLKRVAEQYGVDVDFDPKPIPGDWNGQGCHTNVSTQAMREDGGLEHIMAAMKKLEPKHMEHIKVYGEGNNRRLTGRHETAPIDKFSYGVANRGASIRIPRQCAIDGKGYFEDRRPASNIDPYIVSARIIKTICLDQ